MDNEQFMQRLQASPAYRDNEQVRQIADPILEQMRTLATLPHPPATEKKEVYTLLGTLQQKLTGVIRPTTAHESASIEKAKEIMKGRFFGIAETEKAFGVSLGESDIPALPPTEELERHANMGHTLRLRINIAPDGSPLTMQKMNELLSEVFEENGEKILFDTDWYKEEEFFTHETPVLCWAFTSDSLLPESTEKNYLEQTQLLADYVTNTLFAGTTVPSPYKEAVDEFDRCKKSIATLMDSNWQEAAQQLSALKINRLLRHIPAEALYDFIQTYRNKEDRILENDYTWTPVLSSDGGLVRFGYCVADGAHVPYAHPDYAYDILGVSFSRKSQES